MTEALGHAAATQCWRSVPDPVTRQPSWRALARRVYTIERLPDLLVEAEERFRRLGLTNIETRLGDGASGWPERAPFQGIMVTAAAPSVPTPLTSRSPRRPSRDPDR